MKIPVLHWSPLERYRLTYGLVFAIVGYATFSFITYRVTANYLVAVMPIAGVVCAYLWAILLADELFALFPIHPVAVAIAAKIKTITFVVVCLYGLVALGLWVNSRSSSPLERVPARIVSMTSVDLGTVQYTVLVVDTGTKGRQSIVWNASDDRNLYVGEDVELGLRRGRLGLPRVLEVQQDWEKYYLRMVAVAPDALVGLKGLVLIYATRGDFARAMQWDDTLLARYPTEYSIAFDLGKELTDAKRFADAVTVLRKAAAISREYEVLYALGYALAWAGKKDEAATYLREATEVDPTDWRAFYSLGYVYWALRKLPEAKAAWSRTLELLPHYPEVERNIKMVEAAMR